MKKMILWINVFFLVVYTCFNPVITKAEYDFKDVYQDGKENLNIKVEDSACKTVVYSYSGNTLLDTAVVDKLTGKVYLNEKELSYHFTEGEEVSINQNVRSMPPINSDEAWVPQTILTGMHVNFAPFIDFGANIVSILLTAHIAVLSVTLLARLSQATLRTFWQYVIESVLDDMVDAINESGASTYLNVNFYYDQQITSGMVYLNGGTVPVYAYRYANYRTTITCLGKTYTARTGETGGWWSQEKPFSLKS